MRIGLANSHSQTSARLRRLLAAVPGLEIAWTADDGPLALQLAASQPPDLVLLDLQITGMDSVEVVRRLQKGKPLAVLVVGVGVQRQMDKVYQTMLAGALDAAELPVEMPDGTIEGMRTLLEKIRTAARVLGLSWDSASAARGPAKPAPPLRTRLVLVGASTGGPEAVKAILNNLSIKERVCLILVQHIDVAFMGNLAASLKESGNNRVVLVTPGQEPEPGTILIAATGDHLVMDKAGRLHYQVEPLDEAYRPNVDVFFNSVAEHWPEPGVAVLLTGMGDDGAAGLLKLRARGWHTIAQDEQSSAVWGMPRAAVECRAVNQVLPLDQIAGAIVRHLQSGGQM